MIIALAQSLPRLVLAQERRPAGLNTCAEHRGASPRPDPMFTSDHSQNALTGPAQEDHTTVNTQHHSLARRGTHHAHGDKNDLAGQLWVVARVHRPQSLLIPRRQLPRKPLPQSRCNCMAKPLHLGVSRRSPGRTTQISPGCARGAPHPGPTARLSPLHSPPLCENPDMT